MRNLLPVSVQPTAPFFDELHETVQCLSQVANIPHPRLGYLGLALDDMAIRQVHRAKFPDLFRV